MNRLFLHIVLGLTVFSACAQNLDIADIEVCYDYTHFHRTGKQQSHPMILLANAVNSKFYNPQTEYVDSLEATPEGKEMYNQMKMAAYTSGKLRNVPSRTVPMYVFKHKYNNITEVFDGHSMLMFTYTEQYEPQTWEIIDSTRTVLGYECVMAKTDYHGRHWTAWFTPEIPIQDGPWKLSGLPGLILEATEESGQHKFLAKSISKSERKISPNIGADHYEPTNRISMLKALRKFEDNPEAGIGTALGVSFKVDGGFKVDKSLDFLETDYR